LESRLFRSRHRRYTPAKIININPSIYISGVKMTILSLLNVKNNKKEYGFQIKDFGNDGFIIYHRLMI